MNKDIKFKPADFEAKYQAIWQKERIYQPDLRTAKRPFYNLMMFPYPSAEGLHVGNVYAFTGADIYGRFKRMQGYDVFEPIGLDGFGIHSENYALKVGRHPAEQAKISAKNFYRQLHQIGNGFAWENTLETYDPDYYRWTQWIFVQMFKHGLAYRKKSLINFCPSCKTVLSDEQVIEGKCERCKTAVEKREMEQWFFKITAYAEKLLQNTYKESFKWSEKVKIGQRNWIGKKEGIVINYPIIQSTNNPINQTISCFTTRPDTNFGATFVVVAPEHEFVEVILSGSEGSLANASSNKLRDSSPAKRGQNDRIKEIKEYVEKTKKKSEMERIAEGREKTGVFSGFYAVNQLNDYKMPIYITDFVLGHVGTGAVVGVPGHDKRDFEFAQKFNLPVIRVVVGSNGDRSEITSIDQVQEEEGTMINSEFLEGMDIHKAIVEMMDHLEEKGWGKRVTTYKLRDWCISRQRYWGAPIPMIKCPKCDWVPVPENELPVVLPPLSDWKPEGTGKGPLAKVKSFVETKCPKCGGKADRETDVCDTFLDSSWYFLRYTSVKTDVIPSTSTTLSVNSIEGSLSLSENKGSHSREIPPRASLGRNDTQLPWDPEITKKWLPVTQYTGGAEHTVLHLLYSRFVCMAFKDFGLLDFEEPYKHFYAHGLIIAEGAKMSKSKGNIVVPDEYINKYGADTLRAYLMFLGPFDSGGDFRDTGIAGMYRFLSRVWRLVIEVILSRSEGSLRLNRSSNKLRDSFPAKRGQNDKLTRFMHKTIKEVTEDIENLRYNTAIAHIMEYVNEIQKFEIRNSKFEIIKALLLLLAPFAPHMTEELWQRIRQQKFESIHLQLWPEYEKKYLIEDEVTVVIQVNGKLRDSIRIKNQESRIKEKVEDMVRKSERIKKYIEGKTIRKTIFVSGKLINFVI